MVYIDSANGAQYSTDSARWCGDSGAYLNLAPGPGLTRDAIQCDVRSVWRYAAAISVDAGGAVSLGEGGTPLLERRWNGQPVKFKLEFM
ncbi:MAG: pyridoxal-5'-phosphate-dependent protein subunit beta, partial [Burkholderiales bacterium]|nr:pyridoxal-5'-phosphate-dependent protein subunit beta [Burkholderiales bacterium]